MRYSLRTDEGLRAVVRNGYLPERDLNTGIGQVAVRCWRSESMAELCSGSVAS